MAKKAKSKRRPRIGRRVAVTLDDYKRAAIEEALARCEGHVLAASEVLGLSRSAMYRHMRIAGLPAPGRDTLRPLKRPPRGAVTIGAYERRAIKNAIRDCRGDKIAAANLLLVGKSTLYRKMRRLGMKPRARNPAVRHTKSAIRAIERAIKMSKKPELRRTLQDVKAALRASLPAEKGVFIPRPRRDRAGERRAAKPAPRFSPSWLRKHRARLGLSAADYAALVGVSALSIYNWEKGRTRPRAAQMEKLAKVRRMGKREVMVRLR